MIELLNKKKEVFSRLPQFIQLPAAKAYCARRKRWVKGLKTPVTLIFFVTSRCNLRCGHCFYWRELNKATDDALSLDEIRAIARSFEHPLSLSLTGGEPFLRSDLKEIIQAFHEGCDTREVGIATNGTFETATVQTVHDILREGFLTDLSVQVSLDGLEETHDSIRGIKGSFKKAMNTLKSLAELRNEFDAFYLKTALSIQKGNLTELKDYVENLIPLKIPLRFNIVRGGSFGVFNLPKNAASGFDPKDENSTYLSLEEIERVYGWLKNKSDQSIFHFWPSRQQKIWALSIKMLKHGRSDIPCYADTMESVLYANGDVAFCELSKAYANIRKFDYDFRKLWQSETAEKMRRRISRCCCIHGCNLTTGLTFDPATVISTIKEREIRNI